MSNTGRWNSFRIWPSDIPNAGILHVDHERHGRSGHGGNTLTECINGDIVSFYSNVSGSADALKGHSVAGWTEYRRSTDGGQTWGKPEILDYSMRMWQGDDVFSALVFASVTAPDGTLIVFLPRFIDRHWRRKYSPVYLLSHDHGHSWSEPREVDPVASVHELAVSFNACFMHDDEVFIMFSGGVGGMGPGPYTLYTSKDIGGSFQKRSTLPFDHSNYYGSIAPLEDGRLIAYSYPVKDGGGLVNGFNQGDGSQGTNENHLHYTLSDDRGLTWSKVSATYFAKRLRNPQMSSKIGKYYFMHGRSGSYGPDPGNLVLYASRDGIHWDEGIYLHRKVFKGGDKYSASEIIGKYNSAIPRRLLIQSSVVYDAHTSRVNERHWWIDQIAGTETGAPRYATLHEAAEAGDVQEVEKQLLAGASVVERNRDGHTPMALAILGRHQAVVVLLVRHCVDINGRCKYGFTPLHRAIRSIQLDLVAWLLDQGADLHACESSGTFMPSFVAAAETGSVELIQLLLDRGADIEAKDNDGATALFAAAQGGHLQAVKHLLARGARVDVKNLFGQSVMDVAQGKGSLDIKDALQAFVATS